MARDDGHRFSKPTAESIMLLAGLGVEGDAHCGRTVQHRSRVRRTPSAPNLRQVHLIHAELLDELAAAGFDVAPGAVGENITTRGLDLLGLPTGSVLRVGAEAAVEITGLRNPCRQLDRYARGLQKAVLERDPEGNLVRKAGVMAIVRNAGVVRPGDPIIVQRPTAAHLALQPV